VQEQRGLGLWNISKWCMDVCVKHIKITDNAIIPLKERVVDRKYDRLAWLGVAHPPRLGFLISGC